MTKREKLNKTNGIQILPVNNSWRVKLGKKITQANSIDRQFSTEKEAIGFVEDQLQFRANRTSDLQKMSDSQISDARRAIELLEKQGAEKTLTSAVEFWISKQPKYDPWTVNEACDKFLIDRKPYVSASWYSQLDVYHKGLREDFGDALIHELTEDDVELYLEDRYGEHASRTYNHNLTQIRSLFNFALRKKKLTENVSLEIKRKIVLVPEVGILSPNDIHLLIETAKTEAPELVIPFALQAFAGLRRSESAHIVWGSIKKDQIIVSAGISKTSSRRTAPITPPLRELLKWAESVSKPKDEKVLPYNLSKWNEQRKKVVTECGVEWLKNCLRHSFVTYRLVELKNDTQVALEAGHISSR